jgi:phosphoglucomutase
MTALRPLLEAALSQDQILPTTVLNVLAVHESADTPAIVKTSIEELVETGSWTELNDRFYKALAFGTGGIRGRTIGKIVTAAEKGTPTALGRPQYPAAGTNMMNTTNVARAALGLGEYLLKAFPGITPRMVIAHDTRHFSREFAELVAASVNRQGIDAFLFPEERSTPQLSFSVRWLKAQAGVVVTASHNPSHDNGFKAYFDDGAQVVEPHASGIIAEVSRLAAGGKPTEAATPGKLTVLDAAADEAYLKALETLVLEPNAIRKTAASFRIVYTPIHGAGIKIVPSILDRFGFQYEVVEAQRTADGRFPTVQSPNPENAEALAQAIALANQIGADLVLATDPDADRMGVAVRNPAGDMELLTGNQIGSLLAWYRTERFFAQGILNEQNRSHAALIKTFVTTDLQKKIAEHFGIRCIETLTGFKYIGEKLRGYEEAAGLSNYDNQPPEKKRAALLEKSTFFIFGGEESYGYSGGDYVRDKDANAAVLLFAEAAAWARSQGQTLSQYLDGIYARLGYYTEKLGTLTFEGAAGAAKIQKLLQSYRDQPPAAYHGKKVVGVQDFASDTYQDADGKEIPKETMFIFHLEDGSRMAVRGSGTEPKIKFYFFTRADAGGNLEQAKRERRAFLEAWWTEVQSDVVRRTA